MSSSLYEETDAAIRWAIDALPLDIIWRDAGIGRCFHCQECGIRVYQSQLDDELLCCINCIDDTATPAQLEELVVAHIECALGTEAERMRLIETDEQTASRAKIRDEWRYIGMNVFHCEAAGCDNWARYHLRGSELGSFCPSCFASHVTLRAN